MHSLALGHRPSACAACAVIYVDLSVAIWWNRDKEVTECRRMRADPLCRGVERAAPPADHGVAGRGPVLDRQVCSAACGRVLLLGHCWLLCLLAAASLRLLRACRGGSHTFLVFQDNLHDSPYLPVKLPCMHQGSCLSRLRLFAHNPASFV